MLKICHIKIIIHEILSHLLWISKENYIKHYEKMEGMRK